LLVEIYINLQLISLQLCLHIPNSFGECPIHREPSKKHLDPLMSDSENKHADGLQVFRRPLRNAFSHNKSTPAYDNQFESEQDRAVGLWNIIV
jgi:hypothetical protein